MLPADRSKALPNCLSCGGSGVILKPITKIVNGASYDTTLTLACHCARLRRPAHQLRLPEPDQGVLFPPASAAR